MIDLQEPTMSHDLRQRCQEGLLSRYGAAPVTATTLARLEEELAVITAKHFCGHFQILGDLCRFARSQGIAFSPVGSCGGTMLGYLLGFSNVDPVRHGLLLQRFIDPTRPGMPPVCIAVSEPGLTRITAWIQETCGHPCKVIRLNVPTRDRLNILIATEWSAAGCGPLELELTVSAEMTLLERCLGRVRTRQQDAIDIEKIDPADQRVLELFRRGDTDGIGAFESSEVKRVLATIQPDRVEDLIAADALSRPGLTDYLSVYADRKHGREKTPQSHPLIDGIVAETFGIIAYQEMVMQIFHRIGHLELDAAWRMLKALAMKTSDGSSHREPFVRAATRKGIGPDLAESCFAEILKSGPMSFCKSHSAQRAVTAIQLGYLKTYHRREFDAVYAETLTSGG